MFCPKCATQNNDGAKFCRLCGSDISLVSQAMTGQIAYPIANEGEDDRETRRRSRRGRTPSLERGIKNMFMGFGFLFVAIALSFSAMGRFWWFWMLLPAFSMIGGGVAEYMRSRQALNASPKATVGTEAAMSPARQSNMLPPRNTNELVAQPPSITEGTTRHLGSEGPTKVFIPAERPEQPK